MATLSTVRINENIINEGVPTGGGANTSLTKVSAADFDTEWRGHLGLTGGTISGDLVLQGSLIENVIVVTDTYQILATDSTVICNKTTAFTVTLPTAVVGKKITVSNINTGAVTLEGSGADTIDNELSQTLEQWDSIDVRCYVANTWKIV